jgi:hypothetical protein
MENISTSQLTAARDIAKKLLAADSAQIARDVEEGQLQEVENG